MNRLSFFGSEVRPEVRLLTSGTAYALGPPLQDGLQQ